MDVIIAMLVAAASLPFPQAGGAVSSSSFHRGEGCGGQVPLDPAQAYHVTTGLGRLGCAKLCAREDRCLSYTTSGPDCLLYPVRVQSCGPSSPHPHASFYVKRWCYNGGTLVVDNCACPDHTVGDRCQDIMKDCRDWVQRATTDGVYWVLPPAAPHPFQVFCQMAFGGRTYVLKHDRNPPTISFNRTWEEYKTGFGDLSSRDFWLGLRQLDWLIAGRNKILIMQYEGWDSDDNYVSDQRAYGHFRMGDESKDFELMQYWAGSWGGIPDCFNGVIGSKFVTFDHGDDDSLRECARAQGTGWWVKSGGTTCDILCNTNGRLRPNGDSYQMGDVYFNGVNDINMKYVYIFIE